MNLITLRDYQQEALQAVNQEFNNGTTRQLIVLPTGAGKTILFAAIAQQFNKKTLILAHRDELIQQAYDTIKLFWSQADIGICQADKDDLGHQIVIGSVQTCTRPKRLAKLKEVGLNY
jgi:ATP-dependent helicase IRC3